MTELRSELAAVHLGAICDLLYPGRFRIAEVGTETELEEARRKAAHYHAQREEADERIDELEGALGALSQAVLLALRCESQNAPDSHCVVAGEHRTMLEANLAAVRRFLQ